MKKLTGQSAIELLYKDVIGDEKDLLKPENRWIFHCLYVGSAAKRIASKLGLDEDYALALGCVHDIGRKISHPNHVIEGYKYMNNHGYIKEAEICLSHSFINNDINLVAGGAPKNPDVYLYINNFLSSHPLTIYDNIVKICDLFCLDKGFTTIEKRILDVYTRKGIYENSLAHFQSVLKLKEEIEKQMGCTLYELFPEIDEKDINSVKDDYQKVIDMIKEKSSVNKK